MNIDNAFPSKYLKAADLPEDGVAVPFIIAYVSTEEVGRDKQIKPILYFEGQEKGMVLNKTNTNTIKKALGSSDTDEWTGKTILLYSTEVQYGDEMVEAIRVKLKPGKAAKAPAGKQKLAPGETPMGTIPPEEDDRVPF